MLAELILRSLSYDIHFSLAFADRRFEHSNTEGLNTKFLWFTVLYGVGKTDL